MILEEDFLEVIFIKSCIKNLLSTIAKFSAY